MAKPADPSSQSREFAGVLKLYHHYAAFYQSGNQTQFISKHPEIELKVAQAAARAFAVEKGVLYDAAPKALRNPIITVIQVEEHWFPAEMYPDKIQVIERLGQASLGCPEQSAAITFAEAIARSNGNNCIPAIGIAFSAKPSTESEKSKG